MEEDDAARAPAARFLAWLRQHGAKVDRLQWPCPVANGQRGAVAVADIEAEEAMMEIPLKLIISPPVCYASEELRVVYFRSPLLEGAGAATAAAMGIEKKVEKYFAESDENTLVLYLMHERLKGEASFWFPYLAILPGRFDCLAEWSEEEMAQLQDEELVVQAQDRADEMEEGYERFMKQIELAPGVKNDQEGTFSRERYSFALYKWAQNVVSSRAFGRRLKWSALVPFADCLNHGNVQTKYDFDVEGNGMFRLYPTKNTRFPKEYGFCLDDNEWDCVELEIAFAKEMPFFEEKKRIYFSIDAVVGPWKDEAARVVAVNASKGGAGGGPCKLTLFAPSSILLRFFRILAATEQELKLYRDAGELQEFFSQYISFANERTCLLMLKQTLQRALGQHPTTRSQDESLLKKLISNGTGTSRLSNAIRYRMGRKSILERHIAFSDAMLAILNPTLAKARVEDVRIAYPGHIFAASRKCFLV